MGRPSLGDGIPLRRRCQCRQCLTDNGGLLVGELRTAIAHGCVVAVVFTLRLPLPFGLHLGQNPKPALSWVFGRK